MDNYRLSKNEGATYQGSWQLDVRNIDSTCMITRVVKNDDEKIWWSKITHEKWWSDLSDRQWVRIDDDSPDSKELIKCKGKRGKIWLNLETSFGSEQRMLHISKDKRYNFKH